MKTYRDLDGPPALPVIGNLHQIRLDRLHTTLERWADRYGPLYRARLGPIRVAVVSDAAAVRQVHRERPGWFRRWRAIEAVAREIGMLGVFAAEGRDWRRHRGLVAAGFNAARVRPFFPKLAVIVGRLQRKWESAADAGETTDLCRDLMRLTVDVTAELAFGIDFNTVETEGPVIQRHLDRVFPMVHRRINAPLAYWRYFRLPADRALDRALADLRTEVNGIIGEARERLRANPALRDSPSNFLEAIVAAGEDGRGRFSDTDIFANVCTLLLAGEDTTAHTIAWTVHCFMQHPEHFARARAEVDGALAPAAAVGEPEQLERFPFLDACCNESMRLKPVAPVNSLEPVEDAEILGHTIPRGTMVMALNRHIAMQDGNFGDGARFDPERWLAGDARGCPHDVDAFIPFGSGPRFCPGRSLALLQIRTVLAMFCRNFDVEPAFPARPVEEKHAFTMMPENLLVRLSRRAS